MGLEPKSTPWSRKSLCISHSSFQVVRLQQHTWVGGLVLGHLLFLLPSPILPNPGHSLSLPCGEPLTPANMIPCVRTSWAPQMSAPWNLNLEQRDTVCLQRCCNKDHRLGGSKQQKLQEAGTARWSCQQGPALSETCRGKFFS